jgi:hypothetical protein
MGEMKNLYKFTDGKSAGRDMGVHEMIKNGSHIICEDLK